MRKSFMTLNSNHHLIEIPPKINTSNAVYVDLVNIFLVQMLKWLISFIIFFCFYNTVYSLVNKRSELQAFVAVLSQILCIE